MGLLTKSHLYKIIFITHNKITLNLNPKKKP
jgi:hypothetical protein